MLGDLTYTTFYNNEKKKNFIKYLKFIINSTFVNVNNIFRFFVYLYHRNLISQIINT